jgi:hypothetical protein
MKATTFHVANYRKNLANVLPYQGAAGLEQRSEVLVQILPEMYFNGQPTTPVADAMRSPTYKDNDYYYQYYCNVQFAHNLSRLAHYTAQ